MELREALEQVNSRWNDAIARGDSLAAAGLCTEDVILMAQGAPLARGRMEVRALCDEWARAEHVDEARQVLDCGGDGSLAYLAGTYARKVTLGEGGFRIATGKYLVGYKRESDGAWKTHAVSVFAD